MGQPILAAGLLLVLLVVKPPPDPVPDYIFETHKRHPIEVGGLHVIINCGESYGCTVIEVYFQNRYARPCVSELRFEAPKPLVRRRVMPPIIVPVEVLDGEYGYLVQPIGVLLEAQGKTHAFHATCRTKYPQGRGPRLLRHTSGSRMSTGNFRGLHVAFGLLTITHGGLLHLAAGSGLQVKIPFPANVAVEKPVELYTKRETLWEPDAREFPGM